MKFSPPKNIFTFYIANILLATINIFNRHVPKYLLPRGMQVADLNRKRKRKKNRRSNKVPSSNKDPLQSFNDGDVNLDGLEGNDDIESNEMPDFSQGNDDSSRKKQKQEDSSETKKLFSNTETGKSTAGRQAWKEKHRKGKFSKKTRMKDRKNKDPLGF